MTAAAPKVLVIDDEPPIRKLLRTGLATQGYEILEAPNGKTSLELLEHHPDLIILDLGLPDMQGMDLLRTIRARNESVPIVVLSSRSDEAGKVTALDLGADDYLTKPFNPRELVARVKAILRRGERGVRAENASTLRLGDLTVDPARREVRIGSSSCLNLRAQEFDLLLTFAEHRGLVLTREQILQKAWGFDFYGQTRTVDVHVAHLRKKLEPSSVKIETVTGVGYKLVVA